MLGLGTVENMCLILVEDRHTPLITKFANRYKRIADKDGMICACSALVGNVPVGIGKVVVWVESSCDPSG